MFVHRHWARAEARVPSDEFPWTVAAVRGSDLGEDDARRRAEEAAKRAAAHVAEHGPWSREAAWRRDEEGYWYAAQCSAEEMVEELDDGRGRRIAAVTRNSYGALVLNAASVLFVDVDEPPKAGGLLGRLGLGSRDARMIAAMEAAALDEPSLRFEAFRTAGGFRVLVTGRPFDPAGDEAHALMRRLGVDPLYARLCRAQRCFRARLTPKPWRIAMAAPGVRFPFTSPENEVRLREWEIAYHERARGHGACTAFAVRGDDRPDTVATPVVALHARAVVTDGTPLA